MTTQILSGKTLAAEIRAKAAESVQKLQKEAITPTLAVVIATTDESAEFYVRHIAKAAATTGVQTNIIRLNPDTRQAEVTATLQKLANDDQTHGIILQTPLPTGVNGDQLRSLIPPSKDIDGANPLSAGRLLCDAPAFAPSTAVAVMSILNHYNLEVAGKHAVIIGRSRVVGKPLAHLLLAANATVTICHSKTTNLDQITRLADVLIVAIGQSQLITADYIKPGAVVIDVGTNVTKNGTLVGDVDAKSVQTIAGALSPVPGGVGPVTTAILLKQTLKAASQKA